MGAADRKSDCKENSWPGNDKPLEEKKTGLEEKLPRGYRV
jgi:hypothetical protein